MTTTRRPWFRWIFAALAAGSVVTCMWACVIQPQPLPPGATPEGGTRPSPEFPPADAGTANNGSGSDATTPGDMGGGADATPPTPDSGRGNADGGAADAADASDAASDGPPDGAVPDASGSDASGGGG